MGARSAGSPDTSSASDLTQVGTGSLAAAGFSGVIGGGCGVLPAPVVTAAQVAHLFGLLERLSTRPSASHVRF